jgi:hypothetical protein
VSHLVTSDEGTLQDLLPSSNSEPDFDVLDLNSATKFNNLDVANGIWKKDVIEHVVDNAALPLPEPWFDVSPFPTQLTVDLDLLAALLTRGVRPDPEAPVMVALADLTGHPVVTSLPTAAPVSPLPPAPSEELNLLFHEMIQAVLRPSRVE